MEGDPEFGGGQRVMSEIHENRKPGGLEFSPVAKSLVTPRMQDGARGTSCRYGGGFAKQVAGNVEKGEAPTLLRERLEIRLDENLDRFFAVINLDPTGASPKSTSWRRPFSRRMMAWALRPLFERSAAMMASGTRRGMGRITERTVQLSSRPCNERQTPNILGAAAVMTGWCRAGRESVA
jgi:hypothetical protein